MLPSVRIQQSGIPSKGVAAAALFHKYAFLSDGFSENEAGKHLY